MNRKINYFLLTVFCLISLNVVAEENLQIVKMQSEMLRLISTPDKDKFTEVVEQLKAECQKQGDEDPRSGGERKTVDSNLSGDPTGKRIAACGSPK